MKRLAVDIILVAVMVAIAILAMQVYSPSKDDGMKDYSGSSPLEKLTSLAAKLNVRNENESVAIYVSLVGYNAEEQSIDFSIYVGMTMKETMNALNEGSGQMVVAKVYADTLRDVFVETSRILPNKIRKVVVDSVFSDLDGKRDSTGASELIASDPENWAYYLNKVDPGTFATQSELEDIIQKTIDSRNKARDEILQGSQ